MRRVWPDPKLQSMSCRASTGGNPADEFWGGIERMLADVAAQAKADPLPVDFPMRVLTWLHEVLATEAESFWQQDLNGRLRQRVRHEHSSDAIVNGCIGLSNGAATNGRTAPQSDAEHARSGSNRCSPAARPDLAPGRSACDDTDDRRRRRNKTRSDLAAVPHSVGTGDGRRDRGAASVSPLGTRSAIGCGSAARNRSPNCAATILHRPVPIAGIRALKTQRARR